MLEIARSLQAELGRGLFGQFPQRYPFPGNDSSPGQHLLARHISTFIPASFPSVVTSFFVTSLLTDSLRLTATRLRALEGKGGRIIRVYGKAGMSQQGSLGHRNQLLPARGYLLQLKRMVLICVIS